MAALASLSVIAIASISSNADAQGLEDIKLPPVLEGMEVFGDFEYYPSASGVLHLYSDITPEQEFEFRKALIAHPIHTLVLDSPGGEISAALNIAGAVNDRQINTYIAEGGQCASACSFIFLAGKNRQLGPSSALGVHQFAPNRTRITDSGDVYQRAQTVMGNILGMISTFDVPPFVSVRMLGTPPDDMYFFSERELGEIRRGSVRNSGQIDAITAARSAYILALVEAKEAELAQRSKPTLQIPGTAAPQPIEVTRPPAPTQLAPPYPNQSNSSHALQLASFKDERNAFALVADLRKQGYETFTRKEGTLTRVYVYSGDERTAQQMIVDIKEKYALWGQVIRLKNNPTQTPQSNGNRATLSFSLVDVTWVNIKDGTGEALFNGLAERGRNLELEGSLPITMVIGRADAVGNFLYNGRAVDLRPHTRKNVARLTLE